MHVSPKDEFNKRNAATRGHATNLKEIATPSASSSTFDWLKSNGFMCCPSTNQMSSVKGFWNGHEAHMLIDSGASGNFITEECLSPGRETLNEMISIMDPKSVKLANCPTNRITHNFNNKTLPCSFVILPVQ